MREIKFRAFDKNTKIMYQPEKIHNIYFCDGKSADIVTNGLIPHDCDDVELMQYTGLKDKNGVEIFEGDIVKFEIDFGYGLQEVVSEVVFDTAGFKLKSGAGIEYMIKDFGIVIGNIYENPELLEKK